MPNSFLLSDSEYHFPQLKLLDTTKADQIKELTKGFLLSRSTLDRVSDIFTDEIRLGFTSSEVKHSSLLCANTFVTEPPNGKEKGNFLSLDLGSSNFRVVLSKLDPDGQNEFHIKHYTVPTKLRRGDSKPLFNFFAECIDDFVKTYLPDNKEVLPMGFTFSFPMFQRAINVAILETWTKDFDCPDAVGQDAGQLMQDAIDEHKGLNVRLVATLNDTTGTLVQGLYQDPTCGIGLIMGTGGNACYIEKIDNVQYWTNKDEWKAAGYKETIIDLECGGFGDNGVIDFAKTIYDKSMDLESLFPHSYTFEKLFGGKFLGEICRRVLVDLAEHDLVFDGKTTDQMREIESFTSKDLSNVESGDQNIYDELAQRFGYDLFTDDDKEVIRYVCALVSVRAALMLSAILSNLVLRIDRQLVTIAVDGSVYKHHPKFHKLMTDFIHELIPKREFKIILAEDGSGKGAGLVGRHRAQGRATAQQVIHILLLTVFDK